MRPRLTAGPAAALAAALASGCGGEQRAAAGPAWLAHEPFPPDGRPRRALLVGVGRYAPPAQGPDAPAGPAPPALSGPRNDVELVRRLLTLRFGFPAASIRTLVDEKATLEAVVTAFREHLIEGVEPDTEVVFWFSGHGSRVTDVSVSGRETDGLDNSLVLHDSRSTGGPPRDLDDDALHTLLSACPSERITVVTDSCHSASATRSGPGATPRLWTEAAAPPDHASWSFWPADLRVLDDDDPARAPPRWTHVAACAHDQQAFEVSVRAGEAGTAVDTTHGQLTWHLCRRLRTVLPGTPWDAIVESVRFALRVDLGQLPQLEEPHPRAVFGDPLARGQPGLACRRLADGRVLVDGGALHGLDVAARCAVVRLSDRRTIGTLAIEGLEAADAVARFCEGPSVDPDPDEALLAVPDAPGDPRRALRVDRASLDSCDAGLRAAVLEIPWLFPVAAGEVPLHWFAPGPEGGHVLTAPDGFAVWAGGVEDCAALARAAAREARFLWLWDLAGGRRGGLVGDLSLEPADAAAVRRLAARRRPGDREVAPARLGSAATGLVLRLAPGTAPTGLARLGLGIRARRAHIVVLDLARSTRHVLPVWPRDGRSATATADRTELLEIGLPAPGASARPVLAAPGPHRLLLVACTRPLDLRSLLVDGETARSAAEAALDGLAPATWGVAGIEVRVEHGR